MFVNINNKCIKCNTATYIKYNNNITISLIVVLDENKAVIWANGSRRRDLLESSDFYANNSYMQSYYCTNLPDVFLSPCNIVIYGPINLHFGIKH